MTWFWFEINIQTLFVCMINHIYVSYYSLYSIKSDVNNATGWVIGSAIPLCWHSKVASWALSYIRNYLDGHDDVIKWKHFPRYWPFVRGIHRSPVDSPHKGQWRRAFVVFFDLCLKKCWANNGNKGDLRRHRAHYDVTVMAVALLFLKI